MIENNLEYWYGNWCRLIHFSRQNCFLNGKNYIACGRKWSKLSKKENRIKIRLQKQSYFYARAVFILKKTKKWIKKYYYYSAKNSFPEADSP